MLLNTNELNTATMQNEHTNYFKTNETIKTSMERVYLKLLTKMCAKFPFANVKN
jgi:hypothetical protein